MRDKENSFNFVIDTDPGTDDSLALALGSVFFKENIVALISSYGNVNGTYTYRNLCSLANMLKMDCPIIRGSMAPLNNKDIVYTDYHGSNGLCGIDIPDTAGYINVGENSSGIDDLYEIIKSKKNVKYISIAPLTNFSKLLNFHPDIVEFIDELIIMGGGFNCFNAGNSTEYNFSLDGAAVGATLKSSVRKTLCPLDMTQKLAFTENEIEMIVGSKRQGIFTNSTPYHIIAQILYKNYDTAILHNEPGAIIHDATPFMYISAPEKCTVSTSKIKSNDFGFIQKCADGDAVKIIENIDKTYVTDTFKKMFKNLER